MTVVYQAFYKIKSNKGTSIIDLCLTPKPCRIDDRI